MAPHRSQCRWEISLPLADGFHSRRVGGAQEVFDARGFFAFADRTGGTAERVERAEESAVDFVRVRDRAGAAPSGGAQGVESAVVADAGVGIGVDETALMVGLIGEFGPGQGGGRQRCGDVDGFLTGVDALLRIHIRVVLRQVGRLRSELARVQVADV